MIKSKSKFYSAKLAKFEFLQRFKDKFERNFDNQ